MVIFFQNHMSFKTKAHDIIFKIELYKKYWRMNTGKSSNRKESKK